MVVDKIHSKEESPSVSSSIVDAVKTAREKLLINTLDNNVGINETSDSYIRRKWHGYCVQAGIVAAHDLVKKHSQEFSNILLLSSHGEAGDYTRAFGDPEFIGHLVCVCRSNDGNWITISPTTYRESHPEDSSESIHIDSSLSSILSYLNTAFGGVWPSEEEIFANYQDPSVYENNDTDVDDELKIKDVIHSLVITWIQKDIDQTYAINKSLQVSREIHNLGSMPREYLFTHDFIEPLEE